MATAESIVLMDDTVPLYSDKFPDDTSRIATCIGSAIDIPIIEFRNCKLKNYLRIPKSSLTFVLIRADTESKYDRKF